MPNLTQKAYSRNIELSHQDGIARGKQLGRQEMEAEMRTQKYKALADILQQGAALAQANAKLTYSLHMLIDKGTRNV